MRTSGRLTQPVRLQPGDHLCFALTGSPRDAAHVARYLHEGLESGQRAAYFADAVPAEAVEAELRTRGVAVDELGEAGSLILAPAEAAYDQADPDEPLAMVDVFRSYAEAAVADGYTALRAAGDATALFDRYHRPGDVLDFEVAADGMVRTAPLVAACLYDATRCPHGPLSAIVAVHPVQILSGVPGPTFTALVDGSRVELTGEIDLGEGEAFGRVLDAIVRGRRDVVVDLAGLTFIDASGLRALGDAADRLAGTLTLSRPSALVRRCLSVFELDRHPKISLN